MAKTKHTFGEYKCKICSKVFSDRTSLAHHTQLHKSGKPFSCSECSFTCKTKKYLSRHVSRVHRKREKDNECEICGKKFLFKTYLDKHMYIHANERPFKCEVCNKGFNSRYSLSSHKHLHTGAKPYKCSYCDYACRDNSTLRKHQERHTGVTRLYQCTVCDKSYKTKRALKTHIAEVHLELTLKTKPCPDCGKLFKCLKTLNTHIKISHLKVNSCKCEICGATLSSKYNMRAHLTTHIDYRPFKCSFQGCGRSYKDKGTLKKHEIIHYPEKHFECSVCKKKFARLHRLQVHKKQHKAKKKCVFCDYCGKGFYNKNYIRSHITRKHMYKERYICDICGFMTYNKPSIVMHIKHGHVSEMDRKCKICKKTFKRHIYLKLHYWNTHSIKYKMNKRRFRKPKQKTNNIIIEETEEPDVKEIQLMHEIKVEPLSDNEEMKDAMEYSNSVLSMDVSLAMCDANEITPDKKFKDFFIQHVVMPPASDDEVSERQQKETDIYVDVTCQREAERIREEMLHKWRQNVGVKPCIRLKRHKDAAINRLNNVKKEKIEITVFTENESHVPAIGEDETKRKNTKTHRKTNVCDKINETIEKFNNLFNEDIREGDEVSKINYKISRIAEEISNNLEKNSNHCNKQILKILDKTFAKYNNLVKKMSDIQNKKQQLSTNIDEVTDRSDEQASIGDENKQSNENNNTMTSLENDENRSSDVIEKSEDSASISDENKINSIHNENNDGIISSVNEELISVDMITTDYDQDLIGVDNSNESNDEIPITYQYDDYLVSKNRKNRENKEKTDEISSLENDESEVIKSGVEMLIGAENVKNGDYKLNDEIKSSENNETRSDNMPITGDSQALLGDKNTLSNCDDCKGLYDVSENDESNCRERIQTGDDQASIEELNRRVECRKNCESTENHETIINYSSDLGQISLENNMLDVNQLNSCHNGIIYENSLAESVKLRKRKCVTNVQDISYVDGTDDDDFRYTNNLKEINSIIKEIDQIVASIENGETSKNDQTNSREIHVVNNSEKLQSIKRTRKPRRKKIKRNLKNRVSKKSDVNITTKIKEIRNELEETNDEIALTENNEIASTENNEIASTENSEIASTENNEIASTENDEIASTENNEITSTENNEIGSTENNEIVSTKLQENEGKNIENHLEERDVNKIWTRRSVRNLNKKVNIDMDSHNDFDSDDDRDQDFVPNDDDDDESGDERNTSNKFKFNSHQCYICFKLYETKEKLLDHCKEHFDVCNLKMLKKCPFCNFVTKLDLVRHVRLIHKVNLNYLYGTLKDRKNNNAKSRFYFNVENNLVDEVEVIPSITNLNRQAFLKIDRKRREKNDKEVKKTKLVKKDGEWIVEKVLINTKKENYVLPDKVEELLKNSEKEKDDENDKDNVDNLRETNEDAGNNDEKQPESDENGNNEDGKGPNNEDYCVKMQKLYRIAKKNGQKMLFPCNKCEKICQTLSALKLHLRRHDPNAKPFKKKVWKHKLSEEELKKLQENKQKSKNITKNHKNRYEKPKPIVNKHKCDPKLKDFYEKNIKGGDIEFWQFLKIFNKMNRENVNDFSDLENRTEFGNHFVDPDLNPPNDENRSSIEDLNPSKESVSSKSNSKLNPIKLGSSKSKKGVVNKITQATKFKRTILITKKEFLRRNAIKDLLRKKNIEKSNTHA